MGKTLNGDTSCRIEALVRDTLWLSAAKTPEQGRLLRMLDKTNLTAEIIGRKGAYSKLCRHIVKSHTQNWYRDDEYRKLHNNFGNVPVVEGREQQEELALMCPWCKCKEGGSKEKCNMRHLHLYCTNKRIQETRELINDILESKVMECMVIANKVQEKQNCK
jgi:hypothetical protein